MCVQRILTLWGRAYLLELEWKCQSLSYFPPPPFSGVLVKHVMSAGGSIGCVCACGGSHVPSPACARPCDAGPVSHPPRPPNYCCAGTHGYTWGTAWMLVLKSAGSQETARFSNTHIFAKKYISIKKQDIIFKINRKKKKWFLLSLASFVSTVRDLHQCAISALPLGAKSFYAFCRLCCTCTLASCLPKWINGFHSNPQIHSRWMTACRESLLSAQIGVSYMPLQPLVC